MYISEEILSWIGSILFFAAIFGYIVIKRNIADSRSLLIHDSGYGSDFFFFQQKHPEYRLEQAEKEYVKLYGDKMRAAIKEKEERDRKEFEQWKKEKRPWEV